jgi:hypothetical protein
LKQFVLFFRDYETESDSEIETDFEAEYQVIESLPLHKYKSAKLFYLKLTDNDPTKRPNCETIIKNMKSEEWILNDMEIFCKYQNELKIFKYWWESRDDTNKSFFHSIIMSKLKVLMSIKRINDY